MRNFTKIAQDFSFIANKFKNINHQTAKIVGEEMVEETRRVFDEESFNGTKWEFRILGTPRNNERNILEDTGALRNGIDAQVNGNEADVGVSTTKYPYAVIHNEGGLIPVTDAMRAHFWKMYYDAKSRNDKNDMEFWTMLALTKKTHFTIPKRQYLGVTPRLQNRVDNAVQQFLINKFEV